MNDSVVFYLFSAEMYNLRRFVTAICEQELLTQRGTVIVCSVDLTAIIRDSPNILLSLF